MELKLEHLAIAMVNNMLLQYFDDERELLHNDCKIVELREEEMTIANSEYQYDVKFDDVKIIARPLSDLAKLIKFEVWKRKNLNERLRFQSKTMKI